MITSAIAFLTSCNIKTETDINKKENTRQTTNYIMNENLSTSCYSDFKGYFPKEGFVPTAEIAFQIAEPVLNHIYGKEIIESEKPFSINLENGVWVIEGTLYSRKGGVAYMEIRKEDGKIQKVLHGK